MKTALLVLLLFSLASLSRYCCHGAAITCPKAVSNLTEFRLKVGFPQGCVPSQCDYFIGINTNSNDSKFIDITLQGVASGWIAVGFTSTSDMFSADVIGCNMYSGDNLTLIETWNPSGYRNNLMNTTDVTTNELCPQTTKLEDGRMTCVFSRAIETTSTSGKKLDMDMDHYLLFGRGNHTQYEANSGFTYHVLPVPFVSSKKVNPVQSEGNITGTVDIVALIKVHGVLMIVAWPMLAGIGVFFSAFMKPALQGGKWFQVHRVLMISSLIIGAVGFSSVFIAHKNKKPPGLIGLTPPSHMVHFVVGIAVMTLHVSNAIIPLFRCKKKDKFRWIYNLVHGKIIGYVLLTLALANCTVGVFIYLKPSNPAFAICVAVFGSGIFLFILYHINYNIVPYIVDGNAEAESYAILTSTKERTACSCFGVGDEGDNLAVGIQSSPISKHSSLYASQKSHQLRLWGTLIMMLVAIIPTMVTICAYIVTKKV